jgi:hypothetical protein
VGREEPGGGVWWGCTTGTAGCCVGSFEEIPEAPGSWRGVDADHLGPPMAAPDGTVLIASSQGLLALDRGDGVLRVERPADDPARGARAVLGSDVYSTWSGGIWRLGR